MAKSLVPYRTTRSLRHMLAPTAGENVVSLLGPFSPEATNALLRAIATHGADIDPTIADTYTRFLHYASRATNPPSFLLDLATCLQSGLTPATPPPEPLAPLRGRLRRNSSQDRT